MLGYSQLIHFTNRSVHEFKDQVIDIRNIDTLTCTPTSNLTALRHTHHLDGQLSSFTFILKQRLTTDTKQIIFNVAHARVIVHMFIAIRFGDCPNDIDELNCSSNEHGRFAHGLDSTDHLPAKHGARSKVNKMYIGEVISRRKPVLPVFKLGNFHRVKASSPIKHKQASGKEQTVYYPITVSEHCYIKPLEELLITDSIPISSCQSNFNTVTHPNRGVRYPSNRSNYFCQCRQGYSDLFCNEFDQCFCSTDSFSHSAAICSLEKNPSKNGRFCAPQHDPIDLQGYSCYCKEYILDETVNITVVALDFVSIK
ncbi:unnamed protein product [Adineta ricciae]|uniref:EGF-like domain-containing protein n=1 Tax=Adineta ricciae TaxID=249248 RepID=A0A815UT96_ADIRI|nr:unnamed protein product [Adineta ricciae]